MTKMPTTKQLIQIALDAQANSETIKQGKAYVELNNLYLAIERKQTRLTITNANQLRLLAVAAYDRFDPMVDYWEREFQKLPRWNEI